MKHDFKIDVLHADRRLDQFLASRLSKIISRTEVQKIIKTHGVLLNGTKISKADIALKKGDSVEIEIPEKEPVKLVGEKIPLDIVFEDKHLLVVNKPRGMVVHPGAGHSEGTLVHALLGANKALSSAGEKDRPGIVHRLDKDTSGLILVAKTDQAHHLLAQKFANRHVNKEYAALVHGMVDHLEGEVDQPIERDEVEWHKRRVGDGPRAKDAFTHYKVIEKFKFASYLHVHPRTGRMHQIRVHLSYIGHPVLGDKIYGLKHDPHECLALHAFRLSLEHPVTEEPMVWEAPLPDDFNGMIDHERKR